MRDTHNDITLGRRIRVLTSEEPVQDVVRRRVPWRVGSQRRPGLGHRVPPSQIEPRVVGVYKLKIENVAQLQEIRLGVTIEFGQVRRATRVCVVRRTRRAAAAFLCAESHARGGGGDTDQGVCNPRR